jgi:hypothetical protein
MCDGQDTEEVKDEEENKKREKRRRRTESCSSFFAVWHINRQHCSGSSCTNIKKDGRTDRHSVMVFQKKEENKQEERNNFGTCKLNVKLPLCLTKYDATWTYPVLN